MLRRARRYVDVCATKIAITTTSFGLASGLKTPPRHPARAPTVSGPLSVTFIPPSVKTPPLMGNFPAGHGAKTLLRENGSTESLTDSTVSPDRPLGPCGPGGPCGPTGPGGPAGPGCPAPSVPWGPCGP